MSPNSRRIGELSGVAAKANTSGNMYTAPASVLDREKKLRDSFDTVKQVIYNIGESLPLVNSEDGTFADKPGFYLIDSAINAKGAIEDAEFDFNKRLLSRAADSAHAVIAGPVTFTHEGGSQPTHMVIAAKPYIKRTADARFSRAHMELNVMQDMWDRGEVGVRPIAVAVTPKYMGERVIIFTKYDKNLTTMDTQPWGAGPTERNIHNATLATKALASFNKMGYKHGDAKIKNVASKQGKGKLGMIDFETTTIIDPSNPNDLESTIQTDLQHMLDSLVDAGMLRLRVGEHYRNNSDQVIEAIRAICQDGYMSCWQDSSPAVQQKVLDTVVHVADEVAKNAFRRLPSAQVTI